MSGNRTHRRPLPSQVAKSCDWANDDVPDWGGDDLKPGTVRAVVRQLGLDWNSFQSHDRGLSGGSIRAERSKMLPMNEPAFGNH